MTRPFDTTPFDSTPEAQLDAAIDAKLQGRANPDEATAHDSETGALLALADELSSLPAPGFKLRLGAQLAQQAGKDFISQPVPADEKILPTLFGEGYDIYPVNRASFAFSVVFHAAAMLALVFSSVWLVQHREQVRTQVISLVTDPSPYILPQAKDVSGGGGGGGDHDKMPASKGEPPRFAREQITPPMAVIRAQNPKLEAEATIVGPPSITFPTGPMGDPLSKSLIASNGPGSNGGIGTGSNGGVGSGNGPGLGPGHGGGYGGGAFIVGNGVSAPRIIYDPDPEYSDEARKARYQGNVTLMIVVDPNGKTRDIQVQRSLGMGLDEKAIEAVTKWRFRPGMKDGQPVAVRVMVDVSFHLY